MGSDLSSSEMGFSVSEHKALQWKRQHGQMHQHSKPTYRHDIDETHHKDNYS